MSQYFGGGGGGGGGGTVTGTGTDNHIVRWNGTGVPVIQDGIAIEDDLGNIFTGDGDSSTPGHGFVSTPGCGMFLAFGPTLGFCVNNIPWLNLNSSGDFTSNGNFTSLNNTSLRGAMIYSSTLSAVSYVVSSVDYQIFITDTSAPRTVTLPASTNDNRYIKIKDASLGALVNNITVTAGGTTLIDGATTQVINTNGGYINVQYNATNTCYYIVG